MGATECNFWGELASHFDFSQPITISDIIGLFAMIAAVVAAIVAVCGNRQAQKASKATEEQFQKNMCEQNRAINVSLFDFRMEVLTNIEYSDYELLERNMTRERMLFDDAIANAIERYVKAMREWKRYGALKNEYLQLIRSQRADDTYEEATDLLKQIDDYSSMEPNSPLYEQIRDSLRNHGYTGKWRYGIDGSKAETVNYVDADDAESKCRFEAEEIRKELLKAAKQFIEISIQ